MLVAASLAVAAALALLPVIGAGQGAPIALGAGLAAVAFVAWTLSTGVTPPIIMATLLLTVELAGVVVFGDPPLGLVPIAAAGLYLLVELSMRSLETRGRHPGWREFRWVDAVRTGGVAVLVGLITWLVTILATGPDLPGGIFMHSVGIAAAAAVIGVIWLLVGREAET